MAFHSTTDDATNPFHSTPSPHRPDNVYNPQPFPLSPVEGNPWQAARPYTPPAPGSMRMPEPVVNGVPVRTHGSVWSSESSHTNAWDTSGESGDISSQNSQGREYRHDFIGQPTVWRSEARHQNAWDDPYPTEASVSAPVEEPAKAPSGKAPAKASGMTPAKVPAKVPVKASTKHSPYWFSGTRYATSEGDGDGEGEGNDEAGEAGENVASAKKPVNPRNSRENGDKPYMGGAKELPSPKRFWLRIFQLVAAVGRFGFQAGAGPFSGQPIPQDFDLASFYLLYVVAWITIVLSIFHIVIYLKRRFGRGEKVKRIIIIVIDLIMAVLWGAGVISEIIKNRCPPGSYDHWCDFYNIAIFWGTFAFLLFVLAVGWDVVGSCSNRRQRRAIV